MFDEHSAADNTGYTDQDLVGIYLDGIGGYPLLTKAEEAVLAQKIEAGREAAAVLAGPDRVAPSKARKLRQTVRDGQEATETFVNANLRLVVSIAKKYRSTGVPLLDLVQEGNLGLMHAVEKFDWRKGFKFSTYATWWIRQAISRVVDNTSRDVRLPGYVRDQIRALLRTRSELEVELGRNPTHAELADAIRVSEGTVDDLLRYDTDPVSLQMTMSAEGDTELSDIVSDPSSRSTFDAVADSLLAGEIDRLLDFLDDRERKVLRLRFGLDGGGPRTLDEIGKTLGVTREHTRQIESKALAKLRHPSADTGARGLLAS